ncbi:MAG: hydrogenase maturation nickel metallochaperone HypA [Deltaproteobacteria bacterium]|nr:hydrogenase maturation nickel metallochaperone HypA [Deltaproteobacteria bacterium]MBW2016274.1 hydrogenase maturation nickel metallochaperone HypA [Deltaproteobacteria bacterium]MBW2128556.1 hydrogenase maturation nickel metallochaperone HypA [Deltaproteobacteria bacterium]MBW2303320.1 hydrogenase maturation nickel metallochaperone HypA [Deltaproteobacteria bacterium]
MHEMSIARDMIRIIREEMESHGMRRVKSVYLRLGKMTGVIPESLSFCFEVMIQGTELEGARLITEVLPLMGMCRECGCRFEIRDYTFLCPSCGSSEVEPVSGRELEVFELEGE